MTILTCQVKICLTAVKNCAMIETMKKISFTFTDDDHKLIEKIQRDLRPSLGKVTLVVAIRAALRKYFEVTK